MPNDETPHPLFPEARNHRPIKWIDVERKTKTANGGYFDRSPRQFRAADLLSLTELHVRYGGGFYRLFARSTRTGPVVAWTECWLPGPADSMTLDPVPWELDAGEPFPASSEPAA